MRHKVHVELAACDYRNLSPHLQSCFPYAYVLIMHSYRYGTMNRTMNTASFLSAFRQSPGRYPYLMIAFCAVDIGRRAMHHGEATSSNTFYNVLFVNQRYEYGMRRHFLTNSCLSAVTQGEQKQNEHSPLAGVLYCLGSEM